jgi:hypothetical protein
MVVEKSDQLHLMLKSLIHDFLFWGDILVYHSEDVFLSIIDIEPAFIPSNNLR